MIWVSLLVRVWVVNLRVVCSVSGVEDFVSQFQLLKQATSTPAGVL